MFRNYVPSQIHLTLEQQIDAVADSDAELRLLGDYYRYNSTRLIPALQLGQYRRENLYRLFNPATTDSIQQFQRLIKNETGSVQWQELMAANYEY